MKFVIHVHLRPTSDDRNATTTIMLIKRKIAMDNQTNDAITTNVEDKCNVVIGSHCVPYRVVLTSLITCKQSETVTKT